MKNNQKLSLLFWLFKAKATKKDGKAPLYVRPTIDGESTEISLSCKVLPENWDTSKDKVIEHDPEYEEINSKIDEAKVDLKRIFKTLQLQYETITPSMLKRAYKGEAPIEVKPLKSEISGQEYFLLEEINQFIKKFKEKVDKNKRKEGTYTHWKTTRNKIKEFISAKYDLEDIPLSSIRYEFAENFFEYMTLEVKHPLADATANTHIKKLKQILIAADKRDKIDKNPIAAYVCTDEEKYVHPLEWDQIISIYQKEFTIDRLAEVRDAFIFQCFTGFAFSDIRKLSADNIDIVGRERKKWLIKDRQKSEVSEMVPILPIVEDLIEKYKTHPYCIEKNQLIPIKSYTNYNGYLKEVAIICGIKKELRTHLARHTFADIMVNNGFILEDVSRMLGHKSIRTTQKYCKIRKPRIAERMRRVEKRLFKNGKLIVDAF